MRTYYRHITNGFITSFLVISTLGVLFLPALTQAAGLEITAVTVKSLENDKLTISWSTNQPAQGWLQVGEQPTALPWTVHANTFESYHEGTVTLPAEKTTYHYRVISENMSGERVVSFTFNIKVDKFTDTTRPEFTIIPKLLYSDNTRAFLLWQTSEHTTANITYSLNPDLSAPKTAHAAADKSKDYFARVELNRLSPNTTYYYEVTIKDDAKNESRTATLTFATKSQIDTEPLRLLQQQPLSSEDPNITDSSIRALWQTSRPSYCEFSYGLKDKNKKKLKETGYESYNHEFLAEDLSPNAEYEYNIYCRDVLGKKLESKDVLFRTRQPQVLGYEYQPGAPISNFYGQSYQLVRAAGSPSIYAIVKKQKYLIKSPSIFSAYGFSWSEVKTISAKELSRYPDAKLVKTTDSPAVYFLYYGLQRKKVLLTETAFKSYRQNNFDKVITVSTADLHLYPDIVLAKNEKDATVYLLQDALKRPIKDMAALRHNGLGNQPIGLISQKDLDSYQTGPLLE